MSTWATQVCFHLIIFSIILYEYTRYKYLYWICVFLCHVDSRSSWKLTTMLALSHLFSQFHSLNSHDETRLWHRRRSGSWWPKDVGKKWELAAVFSDTSLRVAGFKTYMQMKLVMVNALMEAQLVLVWLKEILPSKNASTLFPLQDML